jgi:hypothetical protein
VVVGPRRAGRSSSNGGGRPRWLLLGGGALAIVLVAAAAFALTSGGDEQEQQAGPEFDDSTTVDIEVGAASVHAAGIPAEFPADVRDQVLTGVVSYVDAAMVTPLRKGKADEAKLAALFDQGAAARLAGPDRAVLLDEGLPKVAGAIEVVATGPYRLALGALQERDGQTVLVAAALDLRLTAEAEEGTIEIQRLGSIVFAKDLSGAWKITAWTLGVNRSGPGVTVSTTTPTAAP